MKLRLSSPYTPAYGNVMAGQSVWDHPTTPEYTLQGFSGCRLRVQLHTRFRPLLTVASLKIMVLQIKYMSKGEISC